MQLALNAVVTGDTDSLSRLVASAFCMWRTAVHEAEAKSAARLTILVGALKRLYELGEIADRAEQLDTRAMVDAMVEHIEGHVRNVWRTAFPRDACTRQWPIVVTRRYDLLPSSWRYLTGVETRERRRERMHRDAAA
ncbi:MAG TPA: hypothetical protein VK524_06325 [Polyangiaceae bacterium]|nr:hypothetical protein [Polyangiaceae bacterium]